MNEIYRLNSPNDIGIRSGDILEPIHNTPLNRSCRNVGRKLQAGFVLLAILLNQLEGARGKRQQGVSVQGGKGQTC